MVICKFFQRGMCRYGNQCVNDHSYGQQYSTNNALENEVRNTIITEAETTLHGKQWLLSCFAPFKDKPNLPDFIDDLSFDEVRLKCYQAKESGTIAQYTQELQTRLEEAKQKYQMLQKPNREMLHFLINLHTGNVTSSSTNPFYGSSSSNFGSSSSASNSIFSQAAPNNTNIFNTPQTQTSLFPNNNMFGNTNTGNNFDNNAFTSSTNIFGSSSGSNTFGSSAPENKNIFATSNSAFGSSANVFGTQTTNANTNIFAQAANNIFTQGGLSSQQNTNSLWLGPATTASSNVFGTTSVQTQPIFGQPGNVSSNNAFMNTPNTFISTAPNIFGNAQNSTTTFANLNTEMTSTFGSMPASSSNIFAPQSQSQNNNAFTEIQNAQTNAFGTVQTQNPFTNISSIPANRNIFQTAQDSTSFADNPFFNNSNSTVKQNSNVFGVDNNRNSDTNAYSKVEELTPEELLMYETDDFKIGKIPINPPTYEMCNQNV